MDRLLEYDFPSAFSQALTRAGRPLRHSRRANRVSPTDNEVTLT